VRCRKAHWYLSAQCDDTLSEKQRRDLAAHLEECPSCRREAFYFSEIKGQTGRLDQVRARADFNLRLQAKINAWDAEEERKLAAAPSIWSRMRSYPGVVIDWVVDAGGGLVGQKRYALVGVATLMLVVSIWTGYASRTSFVEGEAAYSQQVDEQEGISSREFNDLRAEYVAGIFEPIQGNQSYLVSGVTLSDKLSPKTQPSYVMPTIPAAEIATRAVF